MDANLDLYQCPTNRVTDMLTVHPVHKLADLLRSAVGCVVGEVHRLQDDAGGDTRQDRPHCALIELNDPAACAQEMCQEDDERYPSGNSDGRKKHRPDEGRQPEAKPGNKCGRRHRKQVVGKWIQLLRRLRVRPIRAGLSMERESCVQDCGNDRRKEDAEPVA